MMGSALSVPLLDSAHEVRLVGTHLDREIIESLKSRGVHPKLKYALPEQIKPFFVEELDQAMQDVELVALGVSSAGVRWAGQKLKPWARADLPILMVAKGLEWSNDRLRVLPDVLREELTDGTGATRGATHSSASEPIAVGGPCIAGELVRRVETCVVFAGRDQATLGRVAALASAAYYHVTTSSDLLGVEACAALKNAYAMGIAFGEGIHERQGGQPGSIALHNYEAAVFAQSVFEMQRIVRLLGGDPASAQGLAGVGDLDVTCNGGRTGRFGKLLGLGLGVEAATARMEGATLECLEILSVLRGALPGLEQRGELRENELPLLRHLIEVALDDKPIAMPFNRFFKS